jgi:hypothetical protein
MQLRVHRLSPEILPPDHKDNHSNDRKANSERHHRDDGWNEPILTAQSL